MHHSFKTREEYESSCAAAAPVSATPVRRSPSFERISRLRNLFTRQTAVSGKGPTTRSWRKQQLTASSSPDDLTTKSDG